MESHDPPRRRPTLPVERRAEALLLGLLVASGCAGERGVEAPASSPFPVQVRDSAGVEIVEYDGALSELPVVFRIVEASALDLGGSRGDPDQELSPRHPFHHPARLTDGRWVVPDATSLKVFDGQGRFLSSMGRRGDGPGEFREPRRVCVAPGDTVLAIDQYGSRVSLFGPDGELARSYNVRGGEPVASGCLADASVLALSERRPDPLDPAYRVGTLLLVDGRGGERTLVEAVPQGTASVIVQGMGNAVPGGERVFVGDGRLAEVRVHRVDGSLARIVRWNAEPVVVTDELFEQIVRMVLPGGNPAETLARQRARPHPRTFPTYQRLLVDEAGRMWVEDYPDFTDPASWRPGWPWTVFDPTGRPLGRVRVPALSSGFVDVRWIGRDRVALHWTDDELGFAHLTFHALEAVAPER